MDQMPSSRAVLTVDVEGYSKRSGPALPQVEQALREDIRRAFTQAGFDWEHDIMDTGGEGDSFTVTVAIEYLHRLVDPIPQNLDRALRLRERIGEQPNRLRVVIHEGPVDEERSGTAKITAGRIREADLGRKILENNPAAYLVLFVSDAAFNKTVEGGYSTAEKSWFTPVQVTNKSYKGRAWVHCPGPEALRLSPEHSDNDIEDEKKENDQLQETPHDLPHASNIHLGNANIQRSGVQVGGNVHGSVTHADRDYVAGNQGDVVHRDKNVSNDTVHGNKGDTVHGDKHGE